MKVTKKVNVKGDVDLSEYTIINLINDEYTTIAKSNDIFYHGVMDSNGNIIIDCKYHKILFTGEVFICKNKSSIYLYDKNGNRLLEDYGSFSFVQYSDSNILAKFVSEYFLLDDKGNTRQAFWDYGYANLFKNSVVALDNNYFTFYNGKYGYLSYDFNKNEKVRDYSIEEDYVKVHTNKNIYFINSDGKIINKVRKTKKLEKFDLIDKSVLIRKNCKLFLTKEDGSKEQIDTKYNNYVIVDNLIIYYKYNDLNTKYVVRVKNNPFSSCLKYTPDTNFSKYVFDDINLSYKDNHYIIFKQNGKYGVINSKTLDFVINPSYDTIEYLGNDNFLMKYDDNIVFANIKKDYTCFLTPEALKEIKDNNYEIRYLGEETLLFSNDKDSKLYSFWDNSIINIDCHDVSNFYNGYAIAKKNDKCGIIDNWGEIIVPFIFDDIRRTGKKFVINGKLVDINKLKYECRLELYNDNYELLYDRKFNKYENMEKAYDYFASEIENNKMEKELYSVKVDDEFIKRFKDADMKKIKGKVKTKNTK